MHGEFFHYTPVASGDLLENPVEDVFFFFLQPRSATKFRQLVRGHVPL